MARFLACLLCGVGCLTAAVWLVVGGWTPPVVAAPPEGLVVSPAVHDFGTVGDAEVLPAEFTVTNNHRQPLRIVAVAESCSCAQAAADSDDLAPGQSTTIRVGWRTHGRRGRTSETLGVRYQVGDIMPVHNFRLTADVLLGVTASPEALRFGRGRPLDQSVSLVVRNPAAVVRAEVAHCSANALQTAIAADGRSVSLHYNHDGYIAPGVNHQVLIKLRGDGPQWLEVPVTFD